MSNSVTPKTAAHQASLSFTISWSLLKYMSTESVIPPTLKISIPPNFTSPLYSFYFFFKVFIYLTVLGLSCSVWDPQVWHVGFSSPTENQTITPFPALGAQSLSHWTTREIPSPFFAGSHHLLIQCSLLTMF